MIDDKAVLTDQDRKFVYVVDEQGIAVRKDVQLGRKVEGLRVVKAGLEDGDRVVVRGAQRIFFPGMPVSAQSVDMRETPTPGRPAGDALNRDIDMDMDMGVRPRGAPCPA